MKYVEDFTDKPAEDYVDADRNQETSYMECDTVAWLKAGTYQISSYTTYSDKKAKKRIGSSHRADIQIVCRERQ